VVFNSQALPNDLMLPVREEEVEVL